MIDYLIVCLIGLAVGYIVGTAGMRQRKAEELQSLIDVEALRRRADGIRRTGDDVTEIEPYWHGFIGHKKRDTVIHREFNNVKAS